MIQVQYHCSRKLGAKKAALKDMVLHTLLICVAGQIMDKDKSSDGEGLCAGSLCIIIWKEMAITYL